MSATEDESDEKEVDSGWDDESEPSEDEVDEAWDSEPSAAATSVAPSAAGASDSVPSVPVETAEVDGGWDDAPAGPDGKPRGKHGKHRERRAKTDAIPSTLSPVVLPRPAQNTKKAQRAHARKARAHEAQAKQKRKDERKA